MDLSCNWGISDYGIATHLLPFLKKWPACRRLKLYQTSIGDSALTALSTWVADGHVHEIHMSDLGGLVTGEAVLAFLREIHRRGRYPYRSRLGGRAALWLRLEHNRIEHADDVIARGRSEGMSLRVLGKADLSTVRPGGVSKSGGRGNPAVNLVLFRLQQSKVPRDESLTGGQRLLALLQEGAPVSPGGGCRPEPQPLSVDEFRLWEMQAREDKELGANERNRETFGEDVATGWSFEENLAANERLGQLGSEAWLQLGRGGCEEAQALVLHAEEAAAQGQAVAEAMAKAVVDDDAEEAATDAAQPVHHLQSPPPRTSLPQRRPPPPPPRQQRRVAAAAAGAAEEAAQEEEALVEASASQASILLASATSAAALAGEPAELAGQDQPQAAESEEAWAPAPEEGGGDGDAGPHPSPLRYRQQQQHLARCEVEEEIAAALALGSTTLQRFDFDGRVRQYLHAVRNVGGQAGVREALQAVRAGTAGKTRGCVQRWPNYLVALLKRFLRDMPNGQPGNVPRLGDP